MCWLAGSIGWTPLSAVTVVVAGLIILASYGLALENATRRARMSRQEGSLRKSIRRCNRLNARLSGSQQEVKHWKREAMRYYNCTRGFEDGENISERKN